MSLTAKDVAEIIRILEESTFDSLTLEMNGMRLELRRGAAAVQQNISGLASATAGNPPAIPQPKTRTIRPPSEPGLAEVTSPLLGIFFRAPKPGEPPFVEVGSKIESETVVGIIEVMKLMNSVRAGVKGEVVEILGANGALVEYGEILLRVRPAK